MVPMELTAAEWLDVALLARDRANRSSFIRMPELCLADRIEAACAGAEPIGVAGPERRFVIDMSDFPHVPYFDVVAHGEGGFRDR